MTCGAVFAWRLLCLCLCVGALGGCQLLMGGLDVKGVATAANVPSNVAVYLSVSQDNEPTTGLTAADFTIAEDGMPLDPSTTKQTLLVRDRVAEHRTLLLVDVSALSNEATRQKLSRAVAGFVAAVRKTQPVTVYLFDGRSTIHRLGDFPVSAESFETPPEIAALDAGSRRDPSRNLNGALLSAVDKLTGLLSSSPKPIRIGSLAFFTWGPDLAGRVPQSDVLDALEAGGYHVFGIGVEGDNAPQLERFATSGVSMAPSPDTIGVAFEEAASKLTRVFNQYYLLSYCSPARSGIRRLRVEVRATAADGDESTGKWESEFESTGFGAGCDPTDTPRFIAQPGSAIPAPIPPPEPSPPPTPAPEPDANEQPAPATPPAAAKSTKPPPPRDRAAPSSVPASGASKTQDTVVPPPEAGGYAPVD
ncbi:MAG: hypothetical protein JW940_15625 [Polyangiaceae bacterium]|nr:hypothetical protein [Polyangiaceae bacterium]